VGHYTLGGRLHFNTGRPYFLTDPNADEYRRLPAYYQVDLRVDRPIYYDRFTLNLYAELVNATLDPQVYAFSQGNNGAISEKTYKIVLPSIGARAEF